MIFQYLTKGYSMKKQLLVFALTVCAPAAATAAVDLGSRGNTQLLRLNSGGVASFNLPQLVGAQTNGIFKLSESPVSSPISLWNYEIHISRIQGRVTPSSTDPCYAISKNLTLFSKPWTTKAGGAGCYAPASAGPWYINVRYTYAGCKAKPCGWNRSWAGY